MAWLPFAGPVPVQLGCACGGVFPAAITAPGQVWTCPSCSRRWRPDPEAVDRVTAAAAELRRIQRLMGVLLLAAAAMAAVLGIVHPGWLIGAPLLVGGAALAARPTYSKRRTRARRALRTPIPVSAAGSSTVHSG
jgi:hypothetical protein